MFCKIGLSRVKGRESRDYSIASIAVIPSNPGRLFLRSRKRFNMIHRRLSSTALLLTSALAIPACTSSQTYRHSEESYMSQPIDDNQTSPPPNIQAWMDRLTVDHEYDPQTGFIVAREIIGLPSVITSGPPADVAVKRGADESKLVVIFATADRCAPCQQYKKSALNNSAVIEALSNPDFIATHVEVDRQPELANQILGSQAIPMTYAFRDGEMIGELRGQRSADELLEWLYALPRS